MKKLLLLLPAATLLALYACEKENFTAQPLALQIPATDCAYPTCEQAIAETKQFYQPLANSRCDTVWVDIICCHDGMKTHALVVVFPQAVKCKTSLSNKR